MRVAAFTLGLIGGLIALYLAFFGASFGALVSLSGARATGQLIVLVSAGLPILGILGAALSFRYPSVASLLMLLSALAMSMIVGFNAATTAPFLLLDVGGLLALAVAPRSAILDRLIVCIVLIELWQIASSILGTYWVSTPWATISRFFIALWDGELIRHAGYTVEEAALGGVIGAVPAIILPFALRRFPTIVQIIDPFMIGGYGLPKLALAPLFILWFGIGIESKIAVVVSIVFFIEYYATLSGVRALDARLVQMAQLCGANERQVARHVVWPNAVPNIFAGLRISLPIAIAVAVVTELISSNRGLGYLVQMGAMNFDITEVFAAILGATVLVLAVGYAVDGTESILLRWRPSGDSLQQQATSTT